LSSYELTKEEEAALDLFDNDNYFREYGLGEMFEVKSNPQLNKDSFSFSDKGEYPYFTRTVLNNGIAGYVDYLNEENKIKDNSIAVGMLGMQFFYMERDFYAGQFTKTIYPKGSKIPNFDKQIAQYFIVLLNKHQKSFQSMLVRDFEKMFKHKTIPLPTQNNTPDFTFMSTFISAISKLVIKDVVDFAASKISAYERVIKQNKQTNQI
ncbi:MAG: restriction endonuclease subunit S, partial [Helicobacter sp.]|nr:restriction endonuclease subunit S [Helicobacter sp.]